MIASLLGFWTCIGLGKATGDAIAMWVISHDDGPAPEFGIEWVPGGGGDRRPSLRRYRLYSARYKLLRRERGEDVRLARRFDAIYYGQYLNFGLLGLYYLGLMLLTR